MSEVLSILLPVRNEGVNIEKMVRTLGALMDRSYEVLVVYDDVSDDTVPVVKKMQESIKHLHLIKNELGRGVANAIRSGVEAAHGEIILIFAADETGPAMAISDMLALMDQGCEFVSCTRYAHGGRRLGGSFIGGILSRLANRLFRLLSKSVFTDATTGIKMFRKSAFKRMSLTGRPVGWSIAFEMAIKAQLSGFVLGEVPIVSIDRLYGGKSTFSVGPWAVEYLRWFVWGVRQMPLYSRIPAPKLLVKGKLING